MDPLRELIEKLSGKIVHRLNQESRSKETRAAALYELRQLGPDITRVQSDVEREHFIESFLAAERARFNADTPAELPSWVERDDSVRPDDEPLCDCHLDCDVKRGKLPPKVTKASSFEQGVREYKHSHPGTPTALDEANQAWRAKQAHVRERLQTILAALADDTPVWELDEYDPETAAATDSEADDGPAPADD